MTRTSIADEVLTAVELVAPGEACKLLGLSTTNPSATLRQYEAANYVLRIDWHGQAVYPRCQFDEARREVYPALREVLAMRTDDWGSEFALLHWLTRPNRSLGGARPCYRLAEDRDQVIEAFAAEISEPWHG